MLRLVMLCAAFAMPLGAAAQSSSHDTGERHGQAKPDPRPTPTGPSIQSVPSGSGQASGDSPRPSCASDHNVGGFCVVN